MERWFKAVTVAFGAVTSYAFGGWSSLLGILLAFVIADYVSGVVAAGIEGRLSSSIGMKGIARKVFIFVVVAAAHLADQALGQNHMLRDATLFFYMANELLSLLENAGRIGVPLPPVLKQAVEILRGKGGATDVQPGAGGQSGD